MTCAETVTLAKGRDRNTAEGSRHRRVECLGADILRWTASQTENSRLNHDIRPSRNCTFIITGARTGVTSAAMTDHHAAPTQTLAPNLQRSEQRKLDHRQNAERHVQLRLTRWREHEQPHMTRRILWDRDLNRDLRRNRDAGKGSGP